MRFDPSPLRRLLIAAALAAAGTESPAATPTAKSVEPAAPAAPVPLLDPLVVTAARAPQPPEHLAASVRSLDAAALRSAPAVTLDGLLRSVPGFGLFRRSDSFSANPTAQGVSLRGLGPSGASRSLLLLDGIPLNDPFGGWVAWSKLPRDGLARAELVPGGGATAWGNAALGGVIQLFSLPPAAAADTRRPAARFSVFAGDFATRSAEVALAVPAGPGTVQLLGRTFATEGFPLVAPERRGPVDRPAGSRHEWLTLRWQHPVSPHLDLLATGRIYSETRENGTAYQRNASRERFASLVLSGRPPAGLSWQASAYAQSQSFASTFGSVNATRTAETPASDQYYVPATALGAAWTALAAQAGGARTSFGADARAVRGETRELFTYAAGQFTRLRVAGGRQEVAGLFAVHDRPLAPHLRLNAGTRLDRWRETDGLRREGDRFTGVLSRDDRYAGRAGSAFSPSLGLVWSAASSLRLRASAQQAFRRPTLNELYRPFRVGPNVTEANAALGTERVRSAELGATWTLRPGRPAATPGGPSAPALSAPASGALRFSATVFHHDLRDAVGNVTLARGPGTYPLFGFIAAGGVGRQRLNLDRTRVRGLELSVAAAPHPAFDLTADYLWNDAVVRRPAAAPALVGRRVAQVPRHTAALGAVWRTPGGFVLTPRLRALGRQFEDDENLLVLGAVVVADLSVARPLSRHLELWATAENLGDARIETGRTADGLVNTGTPRLLLAGLRGTW